MATGCSCCLWDDARGNFPCTPWGSRTGTCALSHTCMERPLPGCGALHWKPHSVELHLMFLGQLASSVQRSGHVFRGVEGAASVHAGVSPGKRGGRRSMARSPCLKCLGCVCFSEMSTCTFLSDAPGLTLLTSLCVWPRVLPQAPEQGTALPRVMFRCLRHLGSFLNTNTA